MPKSDQELADRYRRTQKRLFEMRQELWDRGYTSLTYKRRSGSSARHSRELCLQQQADPDTVKFHKTQVTTITV